MIRNQASRLSSGLHVGCVGLSLNSLSLCLEIVDPFKKLRVDLWIDRDPTQFSASLGHRPQILSVHPGTIAFLPRPCLRQQKSTGPSFK